MSEICKRVCLFGVEQGFICCNNCLRLNICANPCKQKQGECNVNLEDTTLKSDVSELTIEEVNVDLSSLSNLKFEHIEHYTLEHDNIFKEVNGDKPKFVEFNSEPYPYEKALVKAKNELYDMFKDCKSYEEARNIIMTIDTSNLCSEDKGYCILENTTGNLYGCWIVVRGDDKEKSICWDVRWY